MQVTRRFLVDGFLLDCKVTGKSLETISYYNEKLKKFLWYADNFTALLNLAATYS